MSKRPRVMLMVETSLVYGREVLRGISRYMVAHQPWSIYLDLRELIIEPPAWTYQWDGDGVISRYTSPDLATSLRQRGLAVVDLTDVVQGDLGLPHIWTDNREVGRLAATHFLERGLRHFAFCGFSGHDWSLRRREAFHHALHQHASFDVFESPWQSQQVLTWEEQQSQLSAWLTSLPKPVGVLACNDIRGHHVLDACRQLELAVPEEVAVLGVDNDELICQLCDPPLSSVVPNPERVGYEAAALLDQMMRGHAPSQTEVLVEPLGVVTRQSTDMLAIDDPLIADAVRYIREHACENITVDDVLKKVPLSRSMLERRFRKYLKRSPQLEIRHNQLKRVRQLLAETDLNLEHVATLAGFAHAEYMNVVFKRELGLTPGQFRRQAHPQ